MLEPAKYAATYAVALDCDRRTKQGKEDSAAWLAANAGKIAISHDDAIKVAAMVDSVRSHPRAAALLAEGHAEVTLRWSDPVTGAECKARVDWLSPLAAVDVKSCQRGDLLDFAHSVGKWKYARQAAFYLGGLAALSTEPAPLPDTFAFFAVEKDAPHACRVYTISDASLQAAADKLQPLLSLYTACKAANSWPGPTHTIEELDLKPWQI